MVIRDLDALHLRQGDRMEPSPDMPDTSAVLVATDFPFTATLWRPHLETTCRHRNPLFSEELARDPVDSMTVDPLHCLYLGVMKDWCRYVLWTMIMSHLWGEHRDLG